MMLIVADDRVFLNDAEKELKNRDGLLFAENAAQALALVGVIRFTVALIDLNLPDQNGSELIEKIHAVAPNLPILPLSGVSSNAVLESANRVCCDGYTIEIDLLNWISCSSVSMTPLRANRPERSRIDHDEPI